MVQRQGWGSLNMLQMPSGMWSLLNCLSRAGRLWSTYFIDYRCIVMFGKPSEVPTYANQVSKGEEVGAVESVKAASEVEFREKLNQGWHKSVPAQVYSPLTGTVVASNEAVEGKPGLVNSSPEEDGWLFRVLLEDEQEVVLPTGIKSIQKRVLAILVKFVIFRWQG